MTSLFDCHYCNETAQPAPRTLHGLRTCRTCGSDALLPTLYEERPMDVVSHGSMFQEFDYGAHVRKRRQRGLSSGAS